MTDDSTQFIPFDVAQKIVGAVQEEEHIEERDRRILTVYDVDNRELCWFDHDEIMAEVEPKTKEAAVEHILHHIPKWAVEAVLNSMELENKD